MSGCQGREAYLEKFLGGEASAEEVAVFESHAAGCTGCHAAFASVSAFDTALRTALPALAAGLSSPRVAILDQIEVGKLLSAKAPSWNAVRWRAVRWVLLFGFLAAVGVAFEGYATVAIAKRKMLRDVASAEVNSFSRFIERYRELKGSLPDSRNEQMAADLISHWKRQGNLTYPFDSERVVDSQALDPWRRAYVYQSDGDSFILYSLGENGEDDQGKGDDIVRSLPVTVRAG